jgi:hypothetical protein
MRMKSGHAVLLGVYSAWLNFSPRASPGRLLLVPGLISGSNAAIIAVLTQSLHKF